MSESLCQCPVITENGTVKYDIRKLICDYHVPFDETTLTVNILRWWPREQIERFALHLLGDKWQEEAEELRQLRPLEEAMCSLLTALNNELGTGITAAMAHANEILGKIGHG